MASFADLVRYAQQLLSTKKAPGVPPLPGRTSPPPATKGAPWDGQEAQVRAAEAASDTVRPPASDGSPSARAQRLKRTIDALRTGPKNPKTAEKIKALQEQLAALGESGENPVRVAEQRLAKARRDAALYRKPEYQGTGLAEAAAREVEEAIEAYRQAVAAEQASRPAMPPSREQSQDIGAEAGAYRGKNRFEETVSREEAVARQVEQQVLESAAYEQAGKLQGPTQFAAGLGDEAFDAGMPGKPRESITLGQQQRAAMRVDARKEAAERYQRELVAGAIAKVRAALAEQKEALLLQQNPNLKNDRASAARAAERERVAQITQPSKRNALRASIRQQVRGKLQGGQGPRMADEPILEPQRGEKMPTDSRADQLDARILRAGQQLEALAAAMSRGENVDQQDIEWAAEKLNTLAAFRASGARMPRADLARRQNELESVAIQLAEAGIPESRAVEAAWELIEAARLESTYVSLRGDRPVLGAGAGTADYPSATSAVGSPGSATPSSSPAPQPPADDGSPAARAQRRKLNTAELLAAARANRGATPSSSPAPQPPQDRPLPRVEGPPGAGLAFVREEMARARDMADKAGLTRKIFDLSAQGLNASEVARALGEELGALARERDLRPAAFVRAVRNSLNIPSQGVDPQEFTAWQKANGFGPGGAPSAAAADPTGASATSISGPEGESSTLLSVPVTPKASTFVDKILAKYVGPPPERSQAELNRELEAGLGPTIPAEGPGAAEGGPSGLLGSMAATALEQELRELSRVEDVLRNPDLVRLLPPELRDASGVEPSPLMREMRQKFIDAYVQAAMKGKRAPLAPAPADGPLAGEVQAVMRDLDLRGPAQQLHGLILANSSVADGGYVLNEGAVDAIRRALKDKAGGAVSDLARRLRDQGASVPLNPTIQDVADAALGDFFRRLPRAEATTSPDATVGLDPEPKRTTLDDLNRVPAPDAEDVIAEGVEVGDDGNPVLESRGRVFATPAGQVQSEPVPGPEPKPAAAKKGLFGRVRDVITGLRGEIAAIEDDGRPRDMVGNQTPRQGEKIKAPRQGTFLYPSGKGSKPVELLVLEKRGSTSQTGKTVAERRFFRPLDDGRFLEYTINDAGKPIPAAEAVPEGAIHALGNEGFVAAANRVKGARGTPSFRVIPPRQLTEGEARAAGRGLFDYSKEGGNAADADRLLRIYDEIKASGDESLLDAFHSELAAAAPFAPGESARRAGQQKASEDIIEVIRKNIEETREANPEETAGPEGWQEVGAGPSGPPLRPARPAMPPELAFEETAPGRAAQKALDATIKSNPDASPEYLAAQLRRHQTFHARKYINEVLKANGRKPLPETRPFAAVDYMGPGVSDDQLVHALAAFARISPDDVPRPRNELEQMQNFIRVVEAYKNAPDEVLEEALLFAPGKTSAQEAADARFLGKPRPAGSPVSYFRKGDNTAAPLDPAQVAQNLREDAKTAARQRAAQKGARAAYDPNNPSGVFGQAEGAEPPAEAVKSAASQKAFYDAMKNAFQGRSVPLGLQVRGEARPRAGRVGEIADVLSADLDDGMERARELLDLERVVTSAGINAMASQLMAQAKRGGRKTTLSAAKARARKIVNEAVKRMEEGGQEGEIDQALVEQIRQIQGGADPAADDALTDMLSQMESPEQIAFAIQTARRYADELGATQGVSPGQVSDFSAREAKRKAWEAALGQNPTSSKKYAQQEQDYAIQSLFADRRKGGASAADNIRAAAQALFDAGIADRPDDYEMVIRESMRSAGLTRLPGDADGLGYDANQAAAAADSIVTYLRLREGQTPAGALKAGIDESATYEPKSVDLARQSAMTFGERGDELMQDWAKRLERDNLASLETAAQSVTFGYGPFRQSDVKNDIERLRNLAETLRLLEESDDPSFSEGPYGRTPMDRIRELRRQIERTELPQAEGTLRSYGDAARAAAAPTPEAPAPKEPIVSPDPERPSRGGPSNLTRVAYGDPLVRSDQDFPEMPADISRLLSMGARPHVLDAESARLLIEAERGNVLAAANYSGRLQRELEAVQANIRNVEMDPSASPAKAKKLAELQASEQGILKRLEAASQERFPDWAKPGLEGLFEKFAGVNYDFQDGSTVASASRRYAGGDTPQYRAELRRIGRSEDLEGLPENLNVTAFIGPDIEYNHKASTDFLRAFSADDWDDVSDIEPNVLQAAQELRSKVAASNAGAGEMDLIRRIMRNARVEAGDGGRMFVDPSQALGENFFNLLLADNNVSKALSSIPKERRMAHLIGLVTKAPLSTLEFNNPILDAARSLAPRYGATTMPELLAAISEHMGEALPKGRQKLLSVNAGRPDLTAWEAAAAEAADAATAAQMQKALDDARLAREDADMVPLPEPRIRPAAAPPAEAPAAPAAPGASPSSPQPRRGRVAVPAARPGPATPSATPSPAASTPDSVAPTAAGRPPAGAPPASAIRRLAKYLRKPLLGGAGLFAGAYGIGSALDFFDDEDEGAPMPLPLAGEAGFGDMPIQGAGGGGAVPAEPAPLALASAPAPDTNSEVAVPGEARIAALAGRVNRAARPAAYASTRNPFPYATAQNPFPY